MVRIAAKPLATAGGANPAAVSVELRSQFPINNPQNSASGKARTPATLPVCRRTGHQLAAAAWFVVTSEEKLDARRLDDGALELL